MNIVAAAHGFSIIGASQDEEGNVGIFLNPIVGWDMANPELPKPVPLMHIPVTDEKPEPIAVLTPHGKVLIPETGDVFDSVKSYGASFNQPSSGIITPSSAIITP